VGDLSKRLSRHEFACECGCGFSTVDVKLIEYLEACADFFEDNIDHCTRIVMHINSGCRCLSRDKQVKGKDYDPNKKPSEHLFGWASDFWMEAEFEDGQREKISDDLIADYLEASCPNRYGIGRYVNRTHFDVRVKGPARWDLRG